MAQSYNPQGTYRDVQVLSPTQVIEVQVLTAYTIPSNIYFEVPVPMDAYNAGSGPEILLTTAEGLEKLKSEGYVSAVVWEQDLDNSGLIADYAVATITIPTPTGKTGPFSTELQLDLGIVAVDPAIYNAIVIPLIEAAVAQLQKTAAG